MIGEKWPRPLLLICIVLLSMSCRPTSSSTSVARLPTLIPTAFIPTQTATVAPSQTAVPSLTPSITPTPTETAIPPTPSPPPSLYQAVNQSQSAVPLPYLSQFRLVAFYGTPLGPALGILGHQPRDEMIQSLRETAVLYQNFPPNRETVPTFHIIITVADTTPPNYRHHLSLDLINQWVSLAEALEFAVILDIQPGHVSLISEFRRIEDLLHKPHVHLAIDPEFTMDGFEIPGQDLGQLYASEINIIQQELNQIGLDTGVNRLLILHQFDSSMLPDKGNIANYPYVELVIDGDGVGSATQKINNYNRYANQSAFEYGGFKLFPTDGDFPVLSASEIMNQLAPPPAIIIYQ